MQQEAPLTSGVDELTPAPSAASTHSDWLNEYRKDGIFPNESGDVIIVMFHRFARFYAGDHTPNQPFTITHQRFRQLLHTLYNKNFRLISLTDFLHNRISVPAGKIPIVFTFDDGTPGQFHLTKENKTLQVAPNTAVGIMESFYKKHPDFGLEGTFFINLGLKGEPFEGDGTLKERLSYLVDRGFELGNHTYSHVDMRKLKSKAEVIEQVGRNQQALNDILPGYRMTALALPYGRTPKNGWLESALKGEYNGVPFQVDAVLEVGSKPSVPTTSDDFTPTAIHRVRAPGRQSEPTDLNAWLKRKSRQRLFVSDGDPKVVTIPEADLNRLSKTVRQNEPKQLVVY